MFRATRSCLARIFSVYSTGLLVYLAVATVSALTEWGGFIGALHFVGPLPAAIVGFVLATGLNFVLSRHFAFRSQRSLSEEFVLVMVMSVVAFAANILLFYVLYAFVSMNVIIAKVIGTCFGFAFNYGFRQFFIFSRVPRFGPVSEILKGNKKS